MLHGVRRLVNGSVMAVALSLLLSWTLLKAAFAFALATVVTWVPLALSPLGHRAQNDPLIVALLLVGGCIGVAVVLFGAWEELRPRWSDVHGSARFASDPEIKTHLQASDDGLLVGRSLRKPYALLRYAGEAHCVTIAPTRAGKGVGTIIPNLLTLDRAILCVDPKGENARITAAARARYGPVHVLDPFNVSGLPGASFNPMDAIDAGALDAAEDAATLADALVADPPHQIQDAHWNEEAKALLTGLILLVAGEADPGQRTLARLRELVTLPPDRFYDLLQAMQGNAAAHGLIARAANRHLAKSEREAAGVLSSAQRHTHFLDSPRMTAVMARSAFSFADLKRESATIFLVLPPDRLEAYARWLRLMIAQALTTIARTPERPALPILFLLDEFAALGRLEPVERAFGLMAGYGVQLWAILQDLHQLRAGYGAKAGTFLANAGLVQVFNVNDTDTADWVSRALGEGTAVYETRSRSQTHPGLLSQAESSRSTSETEHLARRPLLMPDEVRRMDPDLAILLKAGAPPILARKLRYFADTEFQALLPQR
jgi:type IV secretion system protein VirD4